MSRNSLVARAALIVMVGFLLSKVAGIVRQLAIARVFGTSGVLDAYFAAFTAPDLIFMLISGGALATAFIPIFSEYLNQEGTERDAAWRMASNVLTVTLLLSMSAALIVAALAPWIVRVAVAPGFTPELQVLTVQLMRLILISTVIFSLSGLVTGVLHTLQHFLLPAFAPLFYNAGIIVGALLIVPRMPAGQEVYGLAWGSVLGALLHLAIQVPALLRHRVRLFPVLDLRDPGLRQVALLMAPRAAALGVIYTKFVMRSNFASRLGTGSLSALDFAWDLMQLPETIFGTSVALAVFPTLAALWAQQDRQELAATFNRTIRAILALTVPAAVGLLVLGTPIVRAFYERGEFGEESSAAVSYALGFFAFGIIGHGLLEIVARLFYAQKDTLRPLYAAIAMLVVTSVVAWGLLDVLGIGSIALGDTLGVFVETGMLLYWMRSRLPETQDGTTVRAAVKIGSAAAAMALVLVAWMHIAAGQSIYLVAAVGILLGGSTYLLIALLLGLEEIMMLPRMLLRRRAAS